MIITAAICTAAVGGLLCGELTGRALWVWLFKPVAAACFIALALEAGALHSDYGRWLLAGLVLSWCGDVLLIPDREPTFMAGLGSFLLGHVCYAIAFLQLPLATMDMLVALPAVAALGGLSLYWLWAHLHGPMRFAVIAYVVVICAMLLMAAGTWGHPAALLIIGGAWGFAISDLAVARDRFVAPGFINRLWGQPLYFGSQMVLAFTATLF